MWSDFVFTSAAQLVVLFCFVLFTVKKPFQGRWHLKVVAETYVLTPSQEWKFSYSPPYMYLSDRTTLSER